MYKKLLFGSVIALNTIVFPLTVVANSLDKDQIKLGCKANQAFTEDIPGFLERDRVANFLHFEVTSSRIVSRFVPLDQQQKPIAIKDLAAIMGYQNLHWINYVESDPYGIDDYQGMPVATPYSDPPPGGYQYDAADRYPFYWDLDKCPYCHDRHHYQHPLVREKYKMTFEDSPTDYRLRPGETVDFVTHLVGVPANKPQSNNLSWDVLTSFRWELTNTVQGRSQITLVETNILSENFSPELQSQMAQDGANLTGFTLVDRNKNNPHNHQCQLQSHRSQHLADFL